MLDHKDFNFGYNWTQDGDVMYLDHLWFNPSLRGERHASFVLDTLVRVSWK
jgi:hypothetical protein